MSDIEKIYEPCDVALVDFLDCLEKVFVGCNPCLNCEWRGKLDLQGCILVCKYKNSVFGGKINE